MNLSILPLKPSTHSVLKRRGFTCTADIEASKHEGGIANFAAELGCSLVDAAGIVREVDSSMRKIFMGVDNVDGGSQTVNEESVIPANASTSSPKERQEQKIIGMSCAPVGVTAASLICLQHDHKRKNPASANQPSYSRHIVSFSKAIDSLLGGGFARSEVTEVVGVPGIGKTQLAMQLCVNTRLPHTFGGVEGEALYLDTEGSFAPERCLSIAEALVQHVHGSAERRRRAATAALSPTEQKRPICNVPEWFTSENILDGIHVCRIYDETAQLATIYSLPDFLTEREELGRPVKIVVVDSIAFHYRAAAPGSDYNSRTRSLASVAACLSDVATKFDIAVVVINQMTTKLGSASTSASFINDASAEEGETRLVPALGESWAHATTSRLMLTHESSSSGIIYAGSNGDGLRPRCCRLVKSPHKPAGMAMYVVTEDGIRDVPLSWTGSGNSTPLALANGFKRAKTTL